MKVLNLGDVFFTTLRLYGQKQKNLVYALKKYLSRTKLIIFNLKILTLQSWDYQKKF